jgi:hypothetical protein
MSADKGKDQKQTKQLFRAQLLAETGTVFLTTLLFSKLVIFMHYPVLNVPIKCLLLYTYTAVLDPLVVYSGYKLTRTIQESQEE